MKLFTHAQLLDELWEEFKSNDFDGPTSQFVESYCILPFQEDVRNFITSPELVEYKTPRCLVKTKKGEIEFDRLKKIWSSGQAVALDIARTKIIPKEWNNIVKRVITITEHIDQGKNIGSDRIVELYLRNGKETIVVTMSKDKIVSTNHYEI